MSAIREIIGNTTTTPVTQSDWNQTDSTKVDYIKNKPNLDVLATKDEVNKINEFIGIPTTVASGTAEAVAPAWSRILIADGISVKEGETYTINGAVTTDEASFSVYLNLIKEGETKYYQQVRITQDNTSRENSLIFTSDGDYDNMRLIIQTDAISDLSVTASIDTVEGENLRETVEQIDKELETISQTLITYGDVLLDTKQGLFSSNNLTIFQTATYGYNYAFISVKGDEVYRVTCYSNNNEYCGAFVYNSENGEKKRLLAGSEIGYTEEQINIPNGYDILCLNTLKAYSGYPISAKKQELFNVDNLLEEVGNLSEESENSNFEVNNLEKRMLKAEKNNDFAWKSFDKPYFVFIHDDTNSYLETFADVFINAGVPMGAATIPSKLNDTHIATLNNIVLNGGEVLAHYNGSPTESSTDEQWLSCTRDIKEALEAYGFEVRGIIRADSTEGGTKKGEKYCRRYFDYANDHMGISTQYNLNRKLMLNYDSVDEFKAQIDNDLLTNGIYGYGFHGGRDDEAWITTDALTEILDYIADKGGVITTYSDLFDTFGSTVLENGLSSANELSEDIEKLSLDMRVDYKGNIHESAGEAVRRQIAETNEKMDMIATYEKVAIEIDPSEWQEVDVTEGVEWVIGYVWSDNCAFETSTYYASPSTLIPAVPGATYKFKNFYGVIKVYDKDKQLLNKYRRDNLNSGSIFTVVEENAAYFGVLCRSADIINDYPPETWRLFRTTPTEEELVRYEWKMTIPAVDELREEVNELREEANELQEDVTEIREKVNEFEDAIPFGVYTADDLRNVTFNQGEIVFYDAARTFVIPVEKHKKYRFTFSGKRNRTWIGGVTGTPFAAGLPAKNIVSAASGETEETAVLECESGEFDYLLAGVAYSYTGELTASVTYEVSDVDGFVIKGIPFATKRDLEEAFQSQGDCYISGANVSVATNADAVHALYDNLVERYPHYVTKNDLGGGLFEYVFSTGNYNYQTAHRNKDAELSKPVVLILAGIHGREKAGVMSTYQLFADMCGNNYNLFDLRENVTFKVIPCGNPSGYDNNTRGNANGVNINRNFDINWTAMPVGNDYAGASPADQIETQILQNWMNSNNTANLYIDYHNSAYTDEVSWVAGQSRITNMDVLKKAYLQGIYDIAPYLEHVQGFSRDVIMAYTGYSTIEATSYRYAEEVGILPVCLECSEDQNNSGLNSFLTIKTGAECLGNMLISVRNRTDLLG